VLANVVDMSVRKIDYLHKDALVLRNIQLKKFFKRSVFSNIRHFLAKVVLILCIHF